MNLVPDCPWREVSEQRTNWGWVDSDFCGPGIDSDETNPTNKYMEMILFNFLIRYF